MSIIKNNFYTVVRLWINQFAMMFFGILILLPSANMKILLSSSHLDQNGQSMSWMMPIASIFSVLFYLVLLFWCCCEVGLGDSVKIEGGRMKKQWFKCTVLALVANTPALIAAITASVSKAFIPGIQYFTSVSRIDIPVDGSAANVYSISTLINEILHIMYRGVLVFFDLDGYPFVYFFVILLSLLACTFGYNAGTKGMFASLLSKKKNKDRG